MTAVPVRLPGQPEPPPLALYVHFPWCVRKCPYCDFNSHASPAEIPEQQYLDALRCDLESSAINAWGRKITSVYLGGGTPSLMEPQSVDRLLSDIRMLVQLAPNAEITLEANPGTVEAGRFREFAATGINRLSLGVQSLNDDSLQRLGRVHDADDARRAAQLAVEIFTRVNLDLITALPGQSIAQALEDARQICMFGAEHISMYRLTLEPGTVFFRHPPPQMPNADQAADLEDAAREVVIASGIPRYEISAHAKIGAHSRHNVNYWLFGDYLGIGAGAHSKLTDTSGVRREVRHKAPERYMLKANAGEQIAQVLKPSRTDLIFEFMLNALRLCDGFSSKLFYARTGIALATIAGKLRQAQERDWLVVTNEKIRPTPTGLDFQTDLCSLFMETDE